MQSEDFSEKNISAVTRTITVLEILAQYHSINLEQLAKETQLPKATLLRFLSTLILQGYVYKDPYDQYSLTLKMFSIASHALEHIDIHRIARPIAEKLAEELGETVHMGIREGDSAVYVLKVESKYTLRMHSRVGKSMPLYCTASGKMLLSDLDDKTLDDLLKYMVLIPFTPHTIRTHCELKAELADVKHKGWAIDHEEHEEGICCIAAGIRDFSHKTTAALSVSWPLFRFEKEQFSSYTKAVCSAADSISQLLGGDSSRAVLS